MNKGIVSTSVEAKPLVTPTMGADPTGRDVYHSSDPEPSAVSLSVDGLDESRFTRLSMAFFLLAVAVYVIARLWHLTSYGLFGDEVFTYWVADQGLGSLLASVRGDVVHPPLFYLVLKGWVAVGGSSILWLKLLPVLFSLASIPFLLLLGRELKMRAAAINLALGLMAFNSFLVSYAQELRMYSLLMMLTLASLWLFVRLINRDAGVARTHLSLVGVNLLLVFTHYYGWVIVALELLFLLVWNRERARGFAVGAGVLVCAFSPWAYAVAREAKGKPERVNFGWNAPPRLSEFVGYYANLNGGLSYRWKVFGTLLVMALFAAPVIVWARRSRAQAGSQASRRTLRFSWFAVFAFAPAVISFCASHVLSQSVWAPRYLIIAAPVYLMMVAVAVFKLPSKPLAVAAAVAVLAWATLSGSIELSNRDRIGWEPLVDQMVRAESIESAGFNVYTTDSNLGNTIQFYLDHRSKQRCEVVYVDKLDNLRGDHFWVAHIKYKHETQPLPQQVLSKSGYEVGAGFEAEAPNHNGFLFPVWKR